MRTIKILLTAIFLFAITNIVFPQQCPPSVSKIQSPICDTPKNLNVNDIKCTTAQLNWQGSKEQKYIVIATGTDNTGNTIFKTDSVNYSYNENDNFSATINVKEGAILNWCVQAICNINGVIIYSPTIEGKETVIPYCQSISTNAKVDSINTNFRVYPNPTTGYLNVEYYSKASGVVLLKVIEVNGKIVYVMSVNAAKGNNSYTLNLRTIIPGTYMLELISNRSVNKIKFVLVKK